MEAPLENDVAAPAQVDGEAVDVKAQIQGFRQRRESRQTKGAVLVFCIGCLIGAAGVNLSSAAKHYGWGGALSHWALGYAINSVGVVLMYTANDIVDLESKFGAMSLQDRESLRWLPCLAAYMALYSSVPASMYQKYGMTCIHLYVTTYLYPAVLLVVALSQKQINIFVTVEQKQVPVWRRRPTLCEWYAIWGVPCLFGYPAIALHNWFYGRWEGARLGHTVSPILHFVGCLCIACHWTKQWGLPAFQRADPAQPVGYGRKRNELLGSMFLQYNIHLGIGAVLFWLLAPENQQQGGNNLDFLDDFEHHLGIINASAMIKPRYFRRQDAGEISIVFIALPLFAFVYRRQILEVLTRPWQQKQRLMDGAFIAALMEQMDQNETEASDSNDGSTGENIRKRDLVSESAMLIRRVPASNLRLSQIASSPRDKNYDIVTAYSVGEACGLGSIDYFVSHSWSDCPKQKYAQLCAVAFQFYRQHGRPPTFWFDKFCINQADLRRTLRCLPIIVQSCSNLLILCGESYEERLWCAFELYIHFAMSGVSAVRRTRIANCYRSPQEAARLLQLKERLRDTARDAETLATMATAALHQEVTSATSDCIESVSVDADNSETNDSVVVSLTRFDVQRARCFSPDDEQKLRQVIESESAGSFNAAIREAATALLDATENGNLRASRAVRSDSSRGIDQSTNPLEGAAVVSAANQALRRDFDALDANKDGRLCTADLLRSTGSIGGACGWLSEEQVDDLLGIVATGPEMIRVNGRLSIGFEEYRAWVRRNIHT
jgi:hypothetical protein